MENNMFKIFTFPFFKNSNYSWFDSEGNAVCYECYKNFAESYLAKLNLKCNIKFDYIRNNSINCVINTSNLQTIHIDMTEATLLKVYEFFYDVNSKVKFIDTKDSNINEKFTSIIKSLDEQKRELIGVMTITDNKNRNMLAEYMSMFAVKFIILHEIGHLIHGHCKYASTINKKSYMFYMNRGYEFIENSLEAKALEMDADSFAACALLDEIIDMIQKNDEIFSVLNNCKDIYGLYAIAIQGVFHLFEENWENVTTSNTHPNAILRGIMCVEGARRKAKLQGLDVMEIFDHSMATLTKYMVKKNNWDEINIVHNMENNAKEFQEILNYWKSTLSKKLKPFNNVYVEDINIFL